MSVRTLENVKIDHSKNLQGADARMRSADMNTLGFTKRSPVRISHAKMGTALVVVVEAMELNQCSIELSETMWGKLADAGVDTRNADPTNPVCVTVSPLTRLERLRRAADLKHIAPILAIVAAIATLLAVLTGQASAAGVNALKVVAAATVFISALCAGWVGWLAAER